MKKPIYDWGNQHATIFDSYIHALDDAGIRYFILRNYEGLPEYNESKDIDLIISCGDLDPEYLSFFATVCHAPVVYVMGLSITM